MAKKKDDILDDMLSTKTPEAAIKDIDVEDVFGKGVEITEESTDGDEGFYVDLVDMDGKKYHLDTKEIPYFKVSTLDKPKAGERYGDKTIVEVLGFNPISYESPFGTKHTVYIKLDDKVLQWAATDTQTAGFLGSGIKKTNMPCKVNLFTWQNPDKPATHPGTNVSMDGVLFRRVDRNNLQPSIDEFLEVDSVNNEALEARLKVIEEKLGIV